MLLKNRNTNFTLAEATFIWKERTYISNVTPKGFFLRIHYLLQNDCSEEESTSLSVKIFEDLDIIVTKEASCNKEASNDFTTDRKHKCSNDDSALIIALKKHIDSLKQQLGDKQFITESLSANLQHHSYHASLSNGNQILVKKHEKNIDLLWPEVDDSFESINEITESIENNKEGFQTDKGKIGNNTNGKNIGSKNVNSNSSNKISKLLWPEVDDSFESINEITESIENNKEGFQTDKGKIGNNTNGKNIGSKNVNSNSSNKISKENQSCKNSRASLQDQTKQMQSSIKLSHNRPNTTAWKDNTPEQTKTVIILGDSIIKRVRGYDLSHSLQNCKVQVKNFPNAWVKCMQMYVLLEKTDITL